MSQGIGIKGYQFLRKRVIVVCTFAVVVVASCAIGVLNPLRKFAHGVVCTIDGLFYH